jgi:preprotein translocase subunit SecY
MFKYLLQIWNSKDLRKKILFTLGILLIYRITVQISIPGADLVAIKSIFNKNQILGAFSLLTGGSAANFSIVLMGISPYINASIIMQLLTVIVPRLESLSKEGEHGRKKINSYTRWLTWPLAFVQSYGMIILLSSQAQTPIIENLRDPLVILPIMLTITTGTLFLVWLGELITEKGIGNGISLIIFASIVSSVPAVVGQSLFLAQQNTEKIIPFVIMVLITIALTVLVVLITEGQRRIPITYAGRGIRAKSEQSVLPMRINQAGMIPIIFAVSIVSFPTIIGQFMQNAASPWVRAVADFINTQFRVYSPTYLLFYFLLIFAFTFFYVSITFNPDQVAENIQKRGGYIPGIRPGKQTAEYLGQVSNRLNFFGGAFLAFVAISPILINVIFSGTEGGSVPLLISGAGMIIVVGVVLELIRQVNAQLVMHDYSKFY